MYEENSVGRTHITITRGDGEDGEDATLLFEITQEPGLSVGFMGYWTCSE